MVVVHSMCVEAQDTWHCQLGEEEVKSDVRQTMITPQLAMKETFDAPYIRTPNFSNQKTL
jgi:hypothetical protein